MDSSTLEEQPIEDILNEILDDDGTADPEFSGGREGEGDEEDFFLDNPCDGAEEGTGNMLSVSAEVVEESEEVSDSVQLEEQPSNGHKSEGADIKPAPAEEVNQISQDNLSKGDSSTRSKIIRIKRTFPSPAGDLHQPARKVVKIQPQPKAREGIPDSLDQVVLNEDGKQRVEKFIKKSAGSTGGNTNNQTNGRVVTNDIPSRVTKDLREKITKKETGNSPQKGQTIPVVSSVSSQAVRFPTPIASNRPALLTSQPTRPLVRLPPRQPPPIRQPGGPQFPRHEFRPQAPAQNQRPPNPSNFLRPLPPPQAPRPVSLPPRPAHPPPVKTIHVNPHFKDRLPIPLAIGNSQSQPSQPPFPQHHPPQSHQQNFTNNQNFYPHHQQQHVQQQQTWNNPQQHQHPPQQHFEQSYAYEEYGQPASEAVYYDYPQHSSGMYSEKSQFDNQQHSSQHHNYQHQQQSSQVFNDGSNFHQRQNHFPPSSYPPQPSAQQQPFPQRPSHPQQMQGPPRRFQEQPGPPRPLQQPQQLRPIMRTPIQPQGRFQGPRPPLQHPPQQQPRFMRPPQSMNRMPVPQNPNFNQNPPTPLQQPRFQNPPGQMRPMLRPQGPLQPSQPRMAPMWVATPQGPRMVPPARPPFRSPHPQQLPPRGGPPFRPQF